MGDQFTADVITVFKTAVASGSYSTSAAGVEITSSRRDLAVGFSMDTGTTDVTQVSAAQTQNTAYLQETGSGGFLEALLAGVAAAGLTFPVTGVSGVSVGTDSCVATNSCPSGNSSSGLSTGAIVGIVIGCVVFVALIAALIYFL